MSETHRHCQCDYCSGEDCGRNDPEAFEAAEKADEKKARDQVLDEVYKRLEAIAYIDFEGGHKNAVVDLSDIDCLFAELKDPEKLE